MSVEEMSNRRPGLVLIVDDDALQRALIRECLELAGFACAEAVDGDDGLSKCARLLPDLVILDVVMPGRDGFSVCTELRADPKTRDIPVLMITGLEDVESVKRAFDIGATNFLTKPINFPQLPYTLKYMLRTSTMEKQIRAAQRLAEESNTAKSQFLAMMSHELRTPLNAVLGFSEMIFTEAFGPEGYARYLEYAKDIHNSATHLLDIINDVLDLSKVNAGQLDLNEAPCCLPDIIAYAAGIVGHRAEESGLTLEVENARDMPLLWTDALRLKQVLINLTSNAIKFTPPGGMVSVRAGLDAERRFVITISDTGIGIAPNKLAKALLPFGQVDADLNRKYEGSGLGLPIAKLLTECLGGDFAIESEVGRGTTLTLTFPEGRACDESGVELRKIAS